MDPVLHGIMESMNTAGLTGIIESYNGLGWKGPYRSAISYLPCHGQGHLPLD